jgi:hypothetical protein
MNATIARERQDNEPAIIHCTWGGWPWRAECRFCTMSSPGQRTREEAREWAESHHHAFHEIG